MTVAELRCEQISASYGAGDVLSRVDIVVPDGTLTAIPGTSGSGKTTLLRLIMGFIAQQSGTVAIGGTVVARAGDTHLPPEKRSIGYVAQEGALYPHLSVAENVLFGLPRRARKASGRASRDSTPLSGRTRARPSCTRSPRRERRRCWSPTTRPRRSRWGARSAC
jgi:iron(III) transport system ATP-binding protein